MRLEDLRRLGGPNVFGSRPVSVARMELDELTCKETTCFAGLAERLAMALPGLRDHHCAAGRPGGFLAAMARGTYFGHVTEHVALELSALAGREAHLGRTMWAGAEGRYDVMMECPLDEPTDSAVPEQLLAVAIQIITDLLAKRHPDVSADLHGSPGRSSESASASVPRLLPQRPGGGVFRSGGSAGGACCGSATDATGAWSARR